jgi:hypothetical protein
MPAAINSSRHPKDIMIITLTNEKININNRKLYCTLSQNILDKLSNSKMLRRKSLSYKIVINNQEKWLICPMIKIPGHVNVVLWPSIKLPFRKYPVHIYFYAVALYLTTGMSMRKTALKVCQKFGLENFSHSTLCRILKKLSSIVDELLSILKSALPPPETSPTIVQRDRWDSVKITRYKKLLSIVHPVLNKLQEVVFSSTLNYIYFNRTQKFCC